MEKYHENKLKYKYIDNLGDFDIYVRKNDDKHNQFYDVFINYHENVNKQSESILIEKNAFTDIESTLQEINADENYREDLHAYVNELLGI